MFVIPGGDQAIIGTTDTFTREKPDQVRASESDIDYLLASANSYFPDAKLTPDDVVAAWAGIRPLAATKAGTSPSNISREHHIERVGNGSIAVSGGKLTTYRAMAAEAVDCLFDELRMKSPACRTAGEELPGGDRNQRRAKIEADDPELARSVIHGLPYTCSDIALAATDEMAVTLADVMVRRTHIAFELSDHGIATARSVANVMGETLRWGEKRTQSRIDEYAGEVERLFGRSTVVR
jgi:glycerol-3-phosphate dehydrogenase